jgi:hypothetical protein
LFHEAKFMRHDPLYLAFDVHCPSAAAMAKVQQLIHRAGAADAVIAIPVVSSEGTSERQLRTGDFFKDIQVLAGFAGNAPSLRVVFCRHPEADRFWERSHGANTAIRGDSHRPDHGEPGVPG